MVFNVQYVFPVDSLTYFLSFFLLFLVTTLSKRIVRNPSTHDAPFTMSLWLNVVVVFAESILC